MESKKQTAVEWLAEELLAQFYLQIDSLMAHELKGKIQQAKEMDKQQKMNNIINYNVKVTEFLLTPLFNLEHSKHGIACSKLADIRNEFIITIGGNNEQ